MFDNNQEDAQSGIAPSVLSTFSTKSKKRALMDSVRKRFTNKFGRENSPVIDKCL